MTQASSQQILVNGEPRELPAGLTVAQLLEALAIRGRIAVEIDGEIVPRSGHASRQLRAGERVEIVHAIGGG